MFKYGWLAELFLILKDPIQRSTEHPYTGASLILEKFFSRSNFYDIACNSILASGPRLDAAITSENI